MKISIIFASFLTIRCLITIIQKEYKHRKYWKNFCEKYKIDKEPS